MRLCVIGDPVGHSLSPRIHRRFMERCGAAGSYEAVTVTAETLGDFVVQGCRGAWDGCNVTMPLKERILPLLDAGGAVDGLLRRREHRMLPEWPGRGVQHRRAGGGGEPAAAGLCTGGAGGAGAGGRGSRQGGGAGTGAGGLPGDGVRPDTGKGSGAGCPVRRCDCLMGGPAPCRRRAWLLLNATPLGMEGSPEFESLDFVQALPAKAVVYDLVYHPTDTALMRAAEHRGLTAVGGLALLVQQAALSFAHFTGIVPDAALCRDILQELEAAQ